MQGLRNVADLSWSHWSSCSEKTHHEPCVVVLCLSIESNDLGSYLHRRQRIVIATCDLCTKRVDPQPTSIGITNQQFGFGFVGLLVGQTGAFVPC